MKKLLITLAVLPLTSLAVEEQENQGCLWSNTRAVCMVTAPQGSTSCDITVVTKEGRGGVKHDVSLPADKPMVVEIKGTNIKGVKASYTCK